LIAESIIKNIQLLLWR